MEAYFEYEQDLSININTCVL